MRNFCLLKALLGNWTWSKWRRFKRNWGVSASEAGTDRDPWATRILKSVWNLGNFKWYCGWRKKLDQGALAMSDPLGPLQLALKPNSASSIDRPLLNFYYCAHWSLIMGNTEAWKQLNWYSTNSDLTVPAEVICQDGGGYMPIANWYSTNSDLTVPAEVICQQQYGGGYMPIDTLRTQT